MGFSHRCKADEMVHGTAMRAARLTRRVLTRLCQRSITVGLYLKAAGVDVDRLDAEARRAPLPA